MDVFTEGEIINMQKSFQPAKFSDSAAFSWHCSDCDQSGQEVIDYPINPEKFEERFYLSHRATTIKMHCVCQGLDLSIWPSKK